MGRKTGKKLMVVLMMVLAVGPTPMVVSAHGHHGGFIIK